MLIRRGAYGLSVPAIQDYGLVSEAPGHWPTWIFDWECDVPDVPQTLSETSAVLRTEPDGMARVDREAGRTTLYLPERPSSDALAHPYLAMTAVLNAGWNGDLALHAGGFVVGGKVFAVLGDRERGKSSTLAWLAAHGFAIVSDDLVITDGQVVRTGPRCLDLRESAATRFGMGEYVGRLGSRDRWRVRLPEIAAELPFGGWLSLRWSDRIDVYPLGLGERLPLLLAARALQLPTHDDRSALPVLAAPAFAFGRPKDFGQLDAAMWRMLEALGGSQS